MYNSLFFSQRKHGKISCSRFPLNQKLSTAGDPNPENAIKEPFKYQITIAGSLPRLYCALYFQAVKSVIQMVIWITDFLRFLNGGLNNRPFNNHDCKCLFWLWFGFKTVTTFCLVFFNLSLQHISVTKCDFYWGRTLTPDSCSDGHEGTKGATTLEHHCANLFDKLPSA